MRIRRIDQPRPGLWALTLGQPDTVLLVVAIAGQPPAVGAVGQRPAGDKADGRVRGFRERLEGAEVNGLFVGGRAVEVRVQLAAQRTMTLRADHRGMHLVEEPGDASLQPLPLPPEDEAILAQHATMRLQDERRACARVLKGARRKLTQRLEAIAQDDARASGAEQRARQVQCLVPEAARAGRGARSLQGIDWTSGEAVPVRLELDPARSARAQLEELFAAARRMKRGEPMRQARAHAARLALAAIEQAEAALACATDPELVQAALQRVLEALPAGIRPRAPSTEAAPRRKADRDEEPGRCARRYTAVQGSVILVGRDAKANDILTTRVARPHDVWMHARGHTGSHVVIAQERGAQPDPQALIDAATLAAHFSSARGQELVEVAWCERRFVRKPKGASPGTVVMSRERTIRLRMESARLQRLLQTVR